MDFKALNEELINITEARKTNTSNGVNLNITPDLITGSILGKPVSDNGYRPMYFADHEPRFSNWKAEFRLGTINKGENINVDGSIKVEKDVLYYVPAKKFTFVCLQYSPQKECWFNHGKWTGNAYPRTTEGQYKELLRCTKAISIDEATKIISGDNNLNVVKEVEKIFNSVNDSDREKLALQIFKIIKQYL